MKINIGPTLFKKKKKQHTDDFYVLHNVKKNCILEKHCCLRPKKLSLTFEQRPLTDFCVCVAFKLTSFSDVIKSLTAGPINGDSPAVHCATVEDNIWCIRRAG